jgi:hypothetical protein
MSLWYWRRCWRSVVGDCSMAQARVLAAHVDGYHSK